MKERITITLDKEMLKILDDKIESKLFGSRSHALEYMIKKRIEIEKENRQ